MPTNNFPGIGYITQGRDYNFFEKVAVSASTFGGGSVDGYQPDLIITFSTQTIIFTNYGSAIVEYSFNGQTVHGELTVFGTNPQRSSLTFENRTGSLIWFRMQSGGSATVAVEAWGIR